MSQLDQAKKKEAADGNTAPPVMDDGAVGKTSNSPAAKGPSPKGSGITETVDQVDAMQTTAKDSEADTQKTIKEGSCLPLNISNISDRSSAELALNHVNESQKLLLEGMGRGEPEGAKEKYQENAKVASLLSSFTDAAAVQTTATSNFQVLYAGMVKDFQRLNQVGISFNGMGIANEDKDGKEHANDKIASTGMGGADAMHAQLEKLKKANPKLGRRADALKLKRDSMDQSEKNVTSKQHGCTSALTGLLGNVHLVQSTANRMAGLETKASFDKAKEEADETNKTIMGVVTALGKGAVSAIKEGPAAGGIEAAKGIGDVVLEKVKKEALKLNERMNISAGYFPNKKDDVAAAQGEDAAREDILNAAAQFKKSRGDVQQSLEDFFNEVTHFETVKAEYRNEIVEFGRDMDAANEAAGGKKGGSSFASMSVFLAEADTFLAQADAVIDVGHKELDVTNAGDASKNASSAYDAHKALGAVNSMGGQTFWRAYKWESTKYKKWYSYDKETFDHIAAREDHIDIKTGANPTKSFGTKNESSDFGSAEGGADSKFAGNNVAGWSIKDAETMKKKVTAFRTAIAAVVLGDSKK